MAADQGLQVVVVAGEDSFLVAAGILVSLVDNQDQVLHQVLDTSCKVTADLLELELLVMA